nr:hypothetical protein [Mycetohabitans sp. B2]
MGESGLAGQLKKQLAERMFAAELTHHLESEVKQGKVAIIAMGPDPRR